MPQWARPLDRSTGAEWHIPRVKSFTTTAYCGKILAGTIEVASEDKAERETRCPRCMKSLLPSQIEPQPSHRPAVQTRATPAKKLQAKKVQAPRPAAKPTARKSTRKSR